MAGFGELVDEMDDIVLEGLGDGEFAYVDRNGHTLVEIIHAAVEEDVERLVQGAIDRVRTMEVRRGLLVPFDRQGAFRDSEGSLWSIDGIHSDDGHLITFYVVPE